MIEPRAPHDQQRQCVFVILHEGCSSGWSGIGHDTQPFGGTTIPAIASKYTAGGTAFSGSSVLDTTTTPGRVDVAAVDRCTG
jgi:hypothetical protein